MELLALANEASVSPGASVLNAAGVGTMGVGSRRGDMRLGGISDAREGPAPRG